MQVCRRSLLRIALLAFTDPAESAGHTRRASLSVTGRSVARHQADVALALRCATIVCLVDAPSPELTLLRAAIENAGARFEIARDLIELRALCGASDELLVLADGLLADPAVAAELMRPGIGVLVQPADIALPLGFERLDLTRAAGGMVLVPGGLLADLPEGYDVSSGLTRVALQAGVPTREVPEDARRRGAWRLVRSEAEAHALDDERIALDLGERRGAGPSEALARIAIRTFGASLLHAGNRFVFLLGSAALLLLALSAGWFGASVLAFALVAMASVVGQGGILLLRIGQVGRGVPAGPGTQAAALDVLLDIVLLLLMIWSAPPFPVQMLTGRAFAPLMLIGFVRLGSTLYSARYARVLADRAVVACALLVAAALHALPAGVELFALTLAFGASVHLGLAAGRRT